MRRGYKVQIVWSDGDVEIVQEGLRDAVFSTKAEAEENAEFMRMGLDEGEAIVNVIRASAGAMCNDFEDRKHSGDAR